MGDNGQALTPAEYDAVKAAADRGDYDRALDLLRGAYDSRAGKVDRDFRYYLACAFERLGRFQEAEAQAAEALALDRTDFRSLELLGTIYLRQGDWVSATGAFRGALANLTYISFRAADIKVPTGPPNPENPNDPFMATHIVIPYDIVDALRELGDYSRIHEFLGICYMKTGRIKEARSALREAIRFAPPNTPAAVAERLLREGVKKG